MVQKHVDCFKNNIIKVNIVAEYSNVHIKVIRCTEKIRIGTQQIECEKF